MAIVRWEPLRDLLAVQHRMDRLFNELGREVPLYGEEAASLSRWAPAADIYETDDNIVMKAEVPGVDAKDLEVRIEDNTFFLKGERKLEKEVKEENYHRIERSYGSFTRSFALPSSVDADNTSAQYKDGVLTLTMPKREESKRTQTGRGSCSEIRSSRPKFSGDGRADPREDVGAALFLVTPSATLDPMSTKLLSATSESSRSFRFTHPQSI